MFAKQISHLDQASRETKQQMKKEKSQGGYMRSLHTVEEKLYSPELKLSGGLAFKLLLYIRHETVRWDVEIKEFSYTELSKKTGIDLKNTRKIIKELIEKKLIIVTKTKKNNQNFKNMIGLNPEYFGEIIEENDRPKLSVIQGGKDKKEEGTGVHRPLEVGVHRPLEVGVYRGNEEYLTNGNNCENSSLKNSSKNNLNNSLKEGEIFNQPKERKTSKSKEEVIQLIAEQTGDDLKIIHEVWNKMEQRGTDFLGKPIVNLCALMASSYDQLKKQCINTAYMKVEKKLDEQVQVSNPDYIRMHMNEFLKKINQQEVG